MTVREQKSLRYYAEQAMQVGVDSVTVPVGLLISLLDAADHRDELRTEFFSLQRKLEDARAKLRRKAKPQPEVK